jgi:hypothetical protein
MSMENKDTNPCGPLSLACAAGLDEERLPQFPCKPDARARESAAGLDRTRYFTSTGMLAEWAENSGA